MKRKNLIIILGCLSMFFGCTRLEVSSNGAYLDLSDDSGVYIGCEGGFMYGNASLSYYSKKTQKSFNQIFFNTNGFPVGDVLQSTKIRGDELFMMVNNSGKILVVDKNTMEYRYTISGLTSPRYIEFIDDKKAYVTDLYAPSISIIDLELKKLVGAVFIGYSPLTGNPRGTEDMVRSGDFIYTSSWSFGDQVYKIDTRIDKVVDSLTVTSQPNSLIIDKNNKLWVLSDGGYIGSPLGKVNSALTLIDLNNFTKEKVFTFGGDTTQSSRLRLSPDGDYIYYVFGSHVAGKSGYGVYKMPIDAQQLPTEALIPAGKRLIYALGIDPYNGDIYIGDAIDYNQRGIAYRYNKEGKELDNFRTGIIPGSFTFTNKVD